MIRKADQRRATLAARQFLEDNNVDDVPVDPLAIALDLKIRLECVNDPQIEFSGCLLREGGLWGIIYRDDIPNDGFKRFTVAHELGHFEMTHHHDALFATTKLHSSESNFTSHLWHEIEADTFAAELLLPERHFVEAIRGTSIGLPAIRDLAAQFDTSLTSTAIRYAGLSPDPVAIVVSTQGRIQYCFASPCMKTIGAYFIEHATPVPHESITYRMWKEGATAGSERRGTSYLSAWFERSTKEIEFNEDVIDLGRYGKVLTVLHATEIPDAEEITELDMEEDPEADKFNRDGKRISW